MSDVQAAMCSWCPSSPVARNNQKNIMSKQGIITGVGTALLISLVAPLSATISTLGTAVDTLLRSDAPGIKRAFVVDFGRRKLGAKESATGDFAALNTSLLADASYLLDETFTFGDVTKGSSEVGCENTGGTGGSGTQSLTPLDSPPSSRHVFEIALNDVFGYSRPTKSIMGMVNGIEDAYLAAVEAGFTGKVVLLGDQLSGNYKVYLLSANTAIDYTDTATGLSSHVMTEEFSQDVTAAASTSGPNNL